MGKVGRFACILTPFFLTIASLICLIIVALGGTNKSSTTLSNLYFLRANTSAVHLNATEISRLGLPSEISSQLGSAIGDTPDGVYDATAALNLSDWYTVSLWNYCEGDNQTETYNEPSYCSPRQKEFWFDPVSIWGLN
ncbi:hypothetical protein MMC08_005977, partial [Hypocenomyce scalaris]|nr:hypothetical protein [Hypocenomyce scalaris]